MKKRGTKSVAKCRAGLELVVAHLLKINRDKTRISDVAPIAPMQCYMQLRRIIVIIEITFNISAKFFDFSDVETVLAFPLP